MKHVASTEYLILSPFFHHKVKINKTEKNSIKLRNFKDIFRPMKEVGDIINGYLYINKAVAESKQKSNKITAGGEGEGASYHHIYFIHDYLFLVCTEPFYTHKQSCKMLQTM